MHVTQTETLVSFEDSTGTVLEEITTLDGAPDSLAHAPGARVMSGTWQGDTLIVTRPGSANRPGPTQRIMEEGGGTELVSVISIPAMGDRPAVEFKRVWKKMDE